MALLNLTLTFTEEDIQALLAEPDAPEYVYSHSEHGEGICKICAPWLGLTTTGDGADGIPVPPLHANCKCYLLLKKHHEAAQNPDAAVEETGQWLQNLPAQDLAGVVGDVRAALVMGGEIEAAEMYYNGMWLTLEEMGYNTAGQPIDPDGNVVRRNGPAFRMDAIIARYAVFRAGVARR